MWLPLIRYDVNVRLELWMPDVLTTDFAECSGRSGAHRCTPLDMIVLKFMGFS